MKRQCIYRAAVTFAVIVTSSNLLGGIDEQRQCPHREYLEKMSPEVSQVEDLLSEREREERASGQVILNLSENKTFGTSGYKSVDGVPAEVVLQGDGKVLTVGRSTYNFNESGVAALMIRYLSNGELDASFAGDGSLLSTHADLLGVYSAAAQSDGKILVTTNNRPAGGGSPPSDCVVARFLTNGVLDATFSGDGIQKTRLGPSEGEGGHAPWVASQSDGKVIIGCTPNVVGGNGAGRGIIRYLSNGELDTTFDGDGTHLTTGYGYGSVITGALQSDGKSLISTNGWNYQGVQRHLSNGSFDTSFDGDGIATSTMFYKLNDLTTQSDGKIIAAGMFTNTWNKFGVARFLTNGSLDTTFSNDGQALINTLAGYYVEGHGASSAALQSDGKIVLAGGVNTSDFTSFVVARFLTNGELDTSFTADGVETYSSNISYWYSSQPKLRLQPDGKMVVAAGPPRWTATDGFKTIRLLSNGELDIGYESADRVAVQSDLKTVLAGSYDGSLVVTRHLLNGVLDTTFEGDGKIFTPLLASSYEDGLALQGDGKIIVAGENSSDFGVHRYLSNGTLDVAFSADGKVSTDFNSDDDKAIVVITQADGKSIAAGKAKVSSAQRMALARYLSNGELDATFDADGKQTTDIAGGGVARCLASQSDGKLVAVGDNGADLAVVRYLTNGALDNTFAGDGIQTTDVKVGTIDKGYGCALQSDGKILASGYNSCWGYFMTRYLSNGVLDTSFSDDGKKLVLSVGLFNSQSLSVLSNGKIMGVGNRSNSAAAMRFLSNGSLDATFGANGIQTMDFNGRQSGLNGIAILPDGRFVAAGSNGRDFAVTRCISCGGADTAFGPGRSEMSAERVLEYQIRACRDDEDYLRELYQKNNH
jgi:uncharacterized delta-60 repeat protein